MPRKNARPAARKAAKRRDAKVAKKSPNRQKRAIIGSIGAGQIGMSMAILAALNDGSAKFERKDDE